MHMSSAKTTTSDGYGPYSGGLVFALKNTPISGSISEELSVRNIYAEYNADQTKLSKSLTDHTPLNTIKSWITTYVLPNIKLKSTSGNRLTYNGTFKSLYDVTGITLTGGYHLEFMYCDITYEYYAPKTTKQYKVRYNGKECAKIKLNGKSME